jgi:polyisoprenoid-binding protein YceI
MLATALVALLFAQPVPVPEASAEPAPAPERWRIVASASRVQFWVRIFGVVPLAGSFPKIAGAITIDSAAGTARVEADVEAGAVTMRRPSHEDWAKSDEFFDAAAHPNIRFESEPFPLTRLDGGGAIQGSLTVRGITKPVGFAIERARCAGIVAAEATDGAPRQCRVELAGSIDRSEFGMQTRGGTLGNRVSLRFEIAARPKKGDGGNQ